MQNGYMGQSISMALESAFFSDKPDYCSKQSEHHMDHNLRFLLVTGPSIKSAVLKYDTM
jgi:hypothetical protein